MECYLLTHQLKLLYTLSWTSWLTLVLKSLQRRTITRLGIYRQSFIPFLCVGCCLARPCIKQGAHLAQIKEHTLLLKPYPIQLAQNGALDI